MLFISILLLYLPSTNFNRLSLTFKPKISLSNDTHRGAKIIAIRFQFNQELINHVKKLDGARWSQSKKCWYIKKEDFNLNIVFKALQEKSHINYSFLENKSETVNGQEKKKPFFSDSKYGFNSYQHKQNLNKSLSTESFFGTLSSSSGNVKKAS